MRQISWLGVVLCVLLFTSPTFGFGGSRWTKNVGSIQSTQTARSQSTEMYALGENPFGSKLMSDVTEDELQDLFKEFNITNFAIDSDPELLKWQPSKEFFEKFGFQNNTERYKRKTMDVKIDFYNSYQKPILPQYKTFIADMMAMTFVQSVDSRYEYDALHAFGICTQYYTIMKGYALQDEIDVIFNEMMKAVGLDSQLIRDDAKRMLAVIKDGPQTEAEVLSAEYTGELADIFNRVRGNRFFKYTDAWGVGLSRAMELLGVEPSQEAFDRWCPSLKWIFAQRLMQTWDEFSGDQVKMQGIEAMQKQLLIREKKRAAARLEKKAADFGEKKRALMELNENIEERRQILIDEQKSLKKKYEPDAYEAILAAESSASSPSE